MATKNEGEVGEGRQKVPAGDDGALLAGDQKGQAGATSSERNEQVLGDQRSAGTVSGRGHDYLPDVIEAEERHVVLLPEPAEEGSVDRRHARFVLINHARAAREQGSSFLNWQDREEQVLLDAVDQKDLDTIFELVWKGRMLG